MIKTFTDYEEFKKEVEKTKLPITIDELKNVSVGFLEEYEEFVVISLPSYSDSPLNILLLSKNENYSITSKTIDQASLKQFKLLANKQFGESTSLSFLVFRNILANYAEKFSKLAYEIEQHEENLDLESLEEANNGLRRLTNRVEDLLDIAISVEENKIRQIKTNYLRYDYDVLLAKIQNLLDRCRNHLNQLRDLRETIQIQAQSKLSSSIEKLTVITIFLTVISVVIAIPNTVGTIFGVPSISEIVEAQTVIEILGISLVLSVVWGIYYWNKKIKANKIR
ncbi:MAG: CorA family divalent cation transporter [Candidatus Micrarchaeota archaeon]